MPVFKNILVPVDFSPYSARAVDTAVELAILFGARLHVVHVEQPVVPAPVPHVPPLIGLEAITEAARAACEKQLLDTAARIRTAGVSAVDTELLEGIAWRAIVDVAQRDGCDLIVMGTHGRSGFQRALLGSVAERVVRKAPCAVLTVHNTEQPAQDGFVRAQTGT